MKKLSVYLPLALLLLASSLTTTGCATQSADAQTTLTPHRTQPYFLVDRPTGFVSYVPEGSVSISVRIQPSVTKPYIEVPRRANSLAKSNDIAWGFGGTLYVKDLEQFKDLFLYQR